MVKIGKVQLSYLFPSPIRLHINRFQQSFECIFCLLNTKSHKSKSMETKDDGAELMMMTCFTLLNNKVNKS